MAKWSYVFLIEWLFISMILHYGYPEDFVSDVCLETAIDFAWRDIACKFTLRKAKSWFEYDTLTCLQKCQGKIYDLDDATWSYPNGFQPKYQLNSLFIRFDGLSKNLKTINTQCDNSNQKRTLEIICKTGFENENITKDLCTSTKVCEDQSKSCSQSSTEEIGVCICRDGYIRIRNKCLKAGIADYLCTSHEDCGEESKICSMEGQVGICTCKSGFIGFGKECLKGNLSLHETCQRNEQCSVVSGSVCQNDTCSCREGYVSFNNDSECSLPTSVSNAQASVQGQKEDNAVSVTVGAVFGGLILGIVLTVLGVIIYKNIRNGKPKAGKKQDLTVSFFNNTSYETEREAHQNHSTVQRTNERKILNVPPFAHSVDLPVMENTYTNKCSMGNSCDVNNDVYNHLHEKEEDSDNDETYDHAHENINRTMEESDYSNLNTGRRYMGPGVSATEDNDYDERELPGDYCSLEKQ